MTEEGATAAPADEPWRRVAELLPAAEDGEPLFSVKKASPGKPRRRRRSALRLLDALGALVWCWLIGNAILDLDGWFVDVLGGWASFLSDYRLVILMVVLAIFTLILKGWKLAGVLAYIALFPLIFGLWKLPVLLFGGRSPVFAVGATHVASAVVGGTRRTIVVMTVAVLAVLMVILSSWNPLIAIGAGLLAAIVLWFIARGLYLSLKPSAFITGQQQAISHFAQGDMVSRLRSQQGGTSAEEVAEWDKQHATNFVTSAGLGVVLYRGLYFWANNLDTYRKSSMSMLFNCLRVIAIAVLTGLGMGLIYFAIYRISPEQFASEQPPTLVTFIYFAFSAAYFGEIRVLAPVGDVALVVKTINGIVSSVIFFTLAAALLLSYRASKSDEVAEEAVSKLRGRATSMRDEVGHAFAAVSTKDLEARLAGFQWAFSGVVTWLIGNTPMPGETEPENHQ